MSSVLSDKKLKQLFQELEEVAPSVDFSQRLRQQIFRKKFYFAAHSLIFIVFLAVLPFSYQNVANDFLRFEILPMLGSILSSFEFSFDFISYQINFIGSFLPLNSIFFFSFNLLIFLAAAFWILKDIKNYSRFFQVVAGIILIFAFCGLPAGHLVLAQSPENPSFDKTSVLPSYLEEEASEQIVLTGVIEEVNIEMAQLIVELRTINKKELFSFRGEKIVMYADEETEIVKRNLKEAALDDLADGDKVTIIGVLSGNTFWAEKIVAVTPWWKKIVSKF